MRYYTTLYLKGQQNCRPSELAVKKIKLRIEIEGPGFDSRQGRTLGDVALRPLELQKPIAPFWKPLLHTILEPEGQRHGSTFRDPQAHLKCAILLHIMVIVCNLMLLAVYICLTYVR